MSSRRSVGTGAGRGCGARCVGDTAVTADVPEPCAVWWFATSASHPASGISPSPRLLAPCRRPVVPIRRNPWSGRAELARVGVRQWRTRMSEPAIRSYPSLALSHLTTGVCSPILVYISDNEPTCA